MKARPVAIPIGKGQVIRDGDDIAGGIAIWGLGALLPLAVELADRLEEQGFSAAVINPRFVKPLDRELLAAYAKR